MISGDEEMELTIGAGGRMLITGGTADDGSWSNVLLLIRLPNQ